MFNMCVYLQQKKPERPDKPSSALTSRARSSSSDKPQSEFSPKTDKKVVKTPPVKPPPPEIHKKGKCCIF